MGCKRNQKEPVSQNVKFRTNARNSFQYAIECPSETNFLYGPLNRKMQPTWFSHATFGIEVFLAGGKLGSAQVALWHLV